MQTMPHARKNVSLSDQTGPLVREYFFKKHRVKTFAYLAVFLLLEVGLVVFAGLGFYFGDPEILINFSGLAVMLCFLGLGIPLGVIGGAFEQRIHKQFVEELQQELGLTYSYTASVNTVQGEVFAMGHTSQIVQVYSGTYKEFPVRTFQYNYMTGGRGTAPRSRWLLVREFDCGFPLPEFVLMPKGLSRENPLWKPRNTSRVRLEGNFSDHFDVWIETQYEIEAMVVLEPHVMTLMLDEFPECGFECSGTKFYVFSKQPMPSRVIDFVRDQGRVRHLFDEMLPELRQVSRDIVAMKERFQK